MSVKLWDEMSRDELKNMGYNMIQYGGPEVQIPPTNPLTQKHIKENNDNLKMKKKKKEKT